MARNCEIEYGIISGIDGDGYDFTVGTVIPKYFMEHLEKTIGQENAKRISIVSVPCQHYLVVQTKRAHDAIVRHLDLRRRAVTECLGDSEYHIINSPEITVFHHNLKNHLDDYVELWLPVEKK